MTAVSELDYAQSIIPFRIYIGTEIELEHKPPIL